MCMTGCRDSSSQLEDFDLHGGLAAECRRVGRRAMMKICRIMIWRLLVQAVEEMREDNQLLTFKYMIICVILMDGKKKELPTRMGGGDT